VPVLKRKAFAYITHRDAEGHQRLIVFSHPHAPAAGIQVPAGSMEDGETPEAAALREAHEETGLQDLHLAGLLGEQVRDMADFGRDEIHHRYFFHLICYVSPSERWQHWEEHPSEGLATRHLFELFWVRLPDGVPELVGDHGRFLPQLVERLSRSKNQDGTQ
jgi:8-oxo-dGTP diphosphatase